jgi:hypothetical protein
MCLSWLIKPNDMSRNVILFIFLGSVFIFSCSKSGNSGPNNSGNGNSNNNNNNPAPAVTISTSLLKISIPGNCSQTITISNSGPKGSTLKYTVADDGALGGFLNFNNASGSLAAGSSINISVNIKTQFINTSPSLAGASLVLNIYTPGASNYTKTPVSIAIKSVADITGTWNGTWNGTTVSGHNPNQPGMVDTVSGTWVLNVQSVDTAKMTATGSLTWVGNDAYWTYTYDLNGNITSTTAEPFPVNRTINFDATNTTITNPTGCVGYQLTILGFKGAANPSDAFYGPMFSAAFDVINNKAVSIGVGFSTHPYAPVTWATFVSSGTVNGTKQ